MSPVVRQRLPPTFAPAPHRLPTVLTHAENGAAGGCKSVVHLEMTSRLQRIFVVVADLLAQFWCSCRDRTSGSRCPTSIVLRVHLFMAKAALKRRSLGSGDSRCPASSPCCGHSRPEPSCQETFRWLNARRRRLAFPCVVDIVEVASVTHTGCDHRVGGIADRLIGDARCPMVQLFSP